MDNSTKPEMIDHFPPATVKTLAKSLTLSSDAKKLIRHVPDFDVEDFAAYYLKRGIPVGSGNVLGYLMQVGPKSKEIARAG